MKPSKKRIRLRVAAGMLALWLAFSAAAILWEVSVQRERELQWLTNILTSMADNVEYNVAYYRDKEPNQMGVFPENNTLERNAQLTWMLNMSAEEQDLSMAVYDEMGGLQAISDTSGIVQTFLPDRFNTSFLLTMAAVDFKSVLSPEAWNTLMDYCEKNSVLSTYGIESDKVKNGSIFYMFYADLWADGEHFIPDTLYVYPCVWLKGEDWYAAVNANSIEELSIEESETDLGKSVEIQVIGSGSDCISSFMSGHDSEVSVRVTGEPQAWLSPEDSEAREDSLWQPVWVCSCDPDPEIIKDMLLCQSSSLMFPSGSGEKTPYLELLRTVSPNDPQGEAEKYDILSEPEELLTMNSLTAIRRRGLFRTAFYTTTSVYPDSGGGKQETYYIASTGYLHPLKNSLPAVLMTLGISFVLFLTVGLVLTVQMGKILDQQMEMEARRRQTTNAIAHDLKTPMAAILGLSENLLEHTKPEKEAHYIQSIRTQTLRMNEIVTKMLELSRLEAGADTLQFETFSLNELAQQAAGAYPGREQMIVVTGDAEITADQEMLLRVLDNLINNAVKHTAPGGVISVDISQNRCAVENPGAPIPEDALPKLWQAYYQADDARSAGGSGLGLTIVKTILDRHGFPCGAENTPGGVRFFFTW